MRRGKKNKTARSGGAPLGNQNAIGNEGGAPSKYKKEYAEQAYKLCLLGCTDADMADFFEVDERTINNWKKEEVEFFQSIKKGKLIADTVVANSLFEKAKGCKITTQQAVKLTTKTPYINPETGQPGRAMMQSEKVVIVDLVQEIPPDTTAAIFWLKNRQRAKWSDKQTVEHQGAVAQPMTLTIVPEGAIIPLASNENEVDLTKDERFT